MRQPITAEVGIALANSLVKRTEVEEELKEWKKKCLPKSAEASVEDTGEENKEKMSDGNLVRRSWWNKFLKRNSGLTAKEAVQCDLQRDDWCFIQNFQAMVESGGESIIDEAHFLDSDRNIVEKEEDACGRKTKKFLT